VLKSIQLGWDFGDSVEVTVGLTRQFGIRHLIDRLSACRAFTCRCSRRTSNKPPRTREDKTPVFSHDRQQHRTPRADAGFSLTRSTPFRARVRAYRVAYLCDARAGFASGPFYHDAT
jgi:hypothetical protein